MTNIQPLIDPETHYRIKLKGPVDVDWLQSFDPEGQISIDENSWLENVTIIDVHTDQSGVIGLMRRLHGLGISILQLQILSDGGQAAKA
jgi:hypothetical protein